MSSITLSYDPALAIQQLSSRDRRLGMIINQFNGYRLSLFPYQNAFQALVRSIIYQQLGARSAQAIHERLLATFPGKHHPRPEEILALTEQQVRIIGLSRAKTIALRDLATRISKGEIPLDCQLKQMTDDEIMESLCKVAGIGPWTVHMLLIFYLGRADVLPATDLGIRNGFRFTYNKSVLPSPKSILAFGQRWRPYRTVASWYLWRASYL